MVIKLRDGTHLRHVSNISFGTEQGIGAYLYIEEDGDYIPLDEVDEIYNDPWGD